MNQYDLTHVPGREHYSFKYLKGGRIFSYAHQIDTVISFEPKSVIEIGAGGGMVTAALRSVGIEVTTVDVQSELKPDVIASVTDLPFEDGRFDVALCCQVLEHLPFDQFVPALKELGRVSRKAVVISLPDCTPHYEVRLRLPKFGLVHKTLSRKKDPSSEYRDSRLRRDGHYWEIGYQEVQLADLLQQIQDCGLRLIGSWRTPEMPWHRFLSLEPSSQ